VYKARPGAQNPANIASSNKSTSLSSASGSGSTSSSTEVTRQHLRAHVQDDAVLLLLPDPVSCFASAAYHQIQTFELEPRASVVLLDWYTSGRRARGEKWDFARYHSINEMFVRGVRVARDAVLLAGSGVGSNIQNDTKEDASKAGVLPARSLADSMGPYACFANVLLYGPATNAIVGKLDARLERETVFRVRESPRILWSVSPLRGQEGRMVRVAGIETEDVKDWLKDAFSELRDVVGYDVYAKAFV
jgi:urease accessory protein